MRSQLVVAWSIACALLCGCRFDRSPLRNAQKGEAVTTDAGSGRADADPSPGDAAAVSGNDGSVVSIPVVDAGASDPGAFDAAAESDGAVMDAAVEPRDSGTVQPPALSCGGTFCALAQGSEEACCTTAADVSSHAARAADRCGLNLSGVTGAPYGGGCWQRDQLGIVDDRCPAHAAGSGTSAEPGCCTDEGTCGSLNADHKLGCRHEPGGTPRACTVEPAKPDAGTTCDPLGAYGIRISVDSTWGGRSGGLWDLTDDGRGTIEVYVLANIAAVDAKTEQFKAMGRVCGVRLPAFFSTTLCEAYQPGFPVEIWESSKLPALDLTGRFDCADSGCTLNIDPKTYLLGFELENPEAAWPGPSMLDRLSCPSGKGAKCFPDHDDDGRPGVGVTLETMGMTDGSGCRMRRYAYRGAPLTNSVAAILDSVRRTDRMQLGIRMKVGGSMRFASDSCDHGSGSALAEYVNSRAAGCLVERGTYTLPNARPAGANDSCDSDEVDFIDENLPDYRVLGVGEKPPGSLDLDNRDASRGPEVSTVRLGDAAAAVSCAAVRDAKY